MATDARDPKRRRTDRLGDAKLLPARGGTRPAVVLDFQASLAAQCSTHEDDELIEGFR